MHGQRLKRGRVLKNGGHLLQAPIRMRGFGLLILLHRFLQRRSRRCRIIEYLDKTGELRFGQHEALLLGENVLRFFAVRRLGKGGDALPQHLRRSFRARFDGGADKEYSLNIK